jgi:spore coat polysaccharide biosynthesis predicted glycosyltransferase SpsG
MRRNKYCIAIKTSAGDSLGTGHIQRMCSLLWYLNERKNIKAFLISDYTGDSFPSVLKKYSKTNFDFLPDIIIRDMRDSSEDEIERLKKTSPVIVIDDNGQGRKAADHAIDILPNPEAKNKEFNNKIFLYGYNFLTALLELNNKNLKKELDFAIYPGNSASSEFIGFLTSLLPEKSSYAMLTGKNSYLIKNGKKENLKESLYAETILSSKAVISHFGITLYESFIAKCKIISINPSEYHSKLADMAGDYLHITNLGESAKLNAADAKVSIKKATQISLCREINAADVFRKVIDGLENFSRLLFDIIGKM